MNLSPKDGDVKITKAKAKAKGKAKSKATVTGKAKSKETPKSKAPKPTKKPSGKSSAPKKHGETDYGKAKKEFSLKFLRLNRSAAMVHAWLSPEAFWSMVNSSDHPRFQSEYDGPAKGRRAALERAWMDSTERMDILKDIPYHEQKRRRYIWFIYGHPWLPFWSIAGAFWPLWFSGFVIPRGPWCIFIYMKHHDF